MFTLPINAIATSAVASGSSYKYNITECPRDAMKGIKTFAQIHRFARFPQGIPEVFDMEYLE